MELSPTAPPGGSDLLGAEISPVPLAFHAAEVYEFRGVRRVRRVYSSTAWLVLRDRCERYQPPAREPTAGHCGP